MKQIPFNPELIGKPGITVKVDGEAPKYIGYFPERGSYSIVYVLSDGESDAHRPENRNLTMYRQTRSAEEIVKEVLQSTGAKLIKWVDLYDAEKELYIALVSAGIDETVQDGFKNYVQELRQQLAEKEARIKELELKVESLNDDLDTYTK